MIFQVEPGKGWSRAEVVERVAGSLRDALLDAAPKSLDEEDERKTWRKVVNTWDKGVDRVRCHKIENGGEAWELSVDLSPSVSGDALSAFTAAWRWWKKPDRSADKWREHSERQDEIDFEIIKAALAATPEEKALAERDALATSVRDGFMVEGPKRRV